MTTPLVSVIMATRNRESLLPEAVDSILKQTFQDFEIIIVDDCSSDNTPEVIRRLEEKDSRVHSVRSDQNIGPGAARNLGVKRASGDFIAIMDDDDLSLPARLEMELRSFENNPESMLVFSSVAWIDNEMQQKSKFPGIIARGEFPEDPRDVFELLYLEGSKIPNTTLLARKSVWEHAEYPESPWIGEDWFFCMQLSALGYRFSAIQEPLVLQRRGANRQGLMNTSKDQRFTWERQILSSIKNWLRERDIITFNNLHKRAFANQIFRESHHYNHLKGFGYFIKASLMDLQNAKFHQELNRFFEFLSNRLKRMFS